MKKFKKNEYANIFDCKVFYCSVDNECTCLQCDEEGVLQVEDVHDLYGGHDEADTRVAFHAVHVEQLNPGNIVIRCNDTDILIIMLSNIQKFSQSHVWLDMGLEYNSNKKNNLMAPFYGWGSTASRLEPLRGGSLLFTTKFPEIPGTHFTDLGRMKG